LFFFYYGGTLFGLDVTDPDQRTTLGTIVFNSFVFMQVFNEINCRNVTRDLNVFRNIHKNYIFLSIVVITIIVQFIIAQYGNIAFQTDGLNWWQWLVCLLVGVFSLPIGFLIRLIPDRPAPVDEDHNARVTREKLLWETAIRDVRRQVRVVHALRHERKSMSLRLNKK